MHFAFSAGPLPSVNRPAQPVNTCAAVVPPLTGVALTQCNDQHDLALNAWQENEDLVNNLEQNALSTDGTTGKLVTAPGSSTNVTAAINDVKTQMSGSAALANTHNQLQTQIGLQAAEDARLKNLTDTTVTGTLQQVQINAQQAADHYTKSATFMSSYAQYNKTNADTSNGNCALGNYTACSQTGAGYAATAAYLGMENTANAQVQSFGAKITEVCLKQNELSIKKIGCNPNSAASAVFIPGLANPPSFNWFDPFTGICLPNAPALCGQIYTVINSTGNLPTNSHQIKSCPGGGTACLSKVIVTMTPLGTKYTFKNKVGKDYSFYANDFKDEKSLIKAGLTPAQAKKLLGDLNATIKVAEKTVGIVVEKLPALKSLALPDLDKNRNPASAKPQAVKPAINPVSQQPVYRRPSTEGLSKNLNGDLIGVRGDDIFKMINRRYQHKDQQVLFYGPYR